jgi:hypothetical protein
LVEEDAVADLTDGHCVMKRSEKRQSSKKEDNTNCRADGRVKDNRGDLVNRSSHSIINGTERNHIDN